MSESHETIAAYVDGELDLIAAKRVEKAMAEDSALAEAVEAERRLRTRLTGHFAPVLDEPVPDRLTALLTGNIDSSLEQRREARAKTRGWSGFAMGGAIAASLAIGMLVGGTAMRGDGYVQSTSNAMVASGQLASALDSQLASTQPADAKIRIGTSFADAQGSYCRTFQSAALDGIACHTEGEWHLRRTQSGKASSEYRQASAGDLAEAAAAMMAGDPLDAADEKAAADKGWEH